AFAQIGIVRLIEHRGDLLERAAQGGLRVQTLLTDDRAGAIHEHRVVEHQQLRVEHVRVFGPCRGGDPRLDLGDLLARSGPRRVETLDLPGDVPFGHAKPPVARAARDDQRAADPNPGRDAQSVQAHGTSSKPRSTSRHNAATASRSSGPSAVIVIELPCAAVSSSRPMMLLPSISRPARATRMCDAKPLAACTNRAAARACSPRGLLIVTLQASIIVSMPNAQIPNAKRDPSGQVLLALSIWHSAFFTPYQIRRDQDLVAPLLAHLARQPEEVRF